MDDRHPIFDHLPTYERPWTAVTDVPRQNHLMGIFVNDSLLREADVTNRLPELARKMTDVLPADVKFSPSMLAGIENGKYVARRFLIAYSLKWPPSDKDGGPIYTWGYFSTF